MLNREEYSCRELSNIITLFGIGTPYNIIVTYNSWIRVYLLDNGPPLLKNCNLGTVNIISTDYRSTSSISYLFQRYYMILNILLYWINRSHSQPCPLYTPTNKFDYMLFSYYYYSHISIIYYTRTLYRKRRTKQSVYRYINTIDIYLRTS